MKKEINDLLLKMQSGENCIGETANKLFDLKESSKQKKILSDEYINKSAPAFFVSEPEASIMTNKWIEGAMWYRKEMVSMELGEVKLVVKPLKDMFEDYAEGRGYKRIKDSSVFKKIKGDYKFEEEFMQEFKEHLRDIYKI
jgi:hypothetical protein